MTVKLRIATRNSPLALWQARYIADKLTQLSPSIATELVPMTTSGDRFLDSQLNQQGGKGLFVKELEDALLHNHADIAVHSMKDVPAMQPEGLGIVAITERDNPYDAFVSTQFASLDDLPPQALIGTSSLRRQSQLLAYRPDLQMVTVRGNIQTRLEKLRAIPFDAIILAAAGLIRMNLRDQIRQIIPEQWMLPACGQGALGIECRLDDTLTRECLTAIADPVTTICVNTERKVNANLGGNCHVPVAVYCQAPQPNHLYLQAKVLSGDGQTLLYAQNKGSFAQAEQLAQDCTEQLFKQGAQQLLNQA